MSSSICLSTIDQNVIFFKRHVFLGGKPPDQIQHHPVARTPAILPEFARLLRGIKLLTNIIKLRGEGINRHQATHFISK